MYELFDVAQKHEDLYLIRIAQNRMTKENEKIQDERRKSGCKGEVKVIVPRDTRRNIKESEATLEIRYKSLEIKRPKIRDKNKNLKEDLKIYVIHTKEKKAPEGAEGIEWFLMTNEAVESAEKAYERVYYIMRKGGR